MAWERSGLRRELCSARAILEAEQPTSQPHPNTHHPHICPCVLGLSHQAETSNKMADVDFTFSDDQELVKLSNDLVRPLAQSCLSKIDAHAMAAIYARTLR